MQTLLNLSIIILIIIFVRLYSKIEAFTHTNQILNNLQLGKRRNMFYDLRGDPHISFINFSPCNNPETFPIRNRSITLS